MLKEEAKNELELSFKSAFRQRCRSADHAVVDPWKDCANPEETRQAYEGDLVLNQVWVDSAKQVRESSDEDPLSARSNSTRASSTDVVASWPLAAAGKHKDSRHSSRRRSTQEPSQTEIRATRRRARSQGCLTLEKTQLPGDVGKRSRRNGHRSGCPMPSSGRDSSAKEKKVEYEDRIRLIAENESEDEIIPTAGSLAVREGTRRQRRFEQRLEESEDSKPHALWLSLDPLSGEIMTFPRPAATRLEAGYVNHRSTVPLAGL